MTIDNFTSMLRNAVEEIGTHLAWNHDWEPVTHIVDQHDAITVVGIDPRFMANDDTKDALITAVLPGIFAHHKATMASFISAGWQSPPPTDGKLPKVRPALDPMRREVVILHTFTANDGRLSIGTIARTNGQPPRIIDWHTTSGTTAGRFAALQQSLALLANTPS